MINASSIRHMNLCCKLSNGWDNNQTHTGIQLDQSDHTSILLKETEFDQGQLTSFKISNIISTNASKQKLKLNLDIQSRFLYLVQKIIKYYWLFMKMKKQVKQPKQLNYIILVILTLNIQNQQYLEIRLQQINHFTNFTSMIKAELRQQDQSKKAFKKKAQKHEQPAKFEKVKVFNTGVRPQQCIANSCTVDIISHHPYPKLTIDEAGLFWHLLPDRFTKSNLVPNTYNYFFGTTSYCFIVQPQDTKYFDNVIKSFSMEKEKEKDPQKQKQDKDKQKLKNKEKEKKQQKQIPYSSQQSDLMELESQMEGLTFNSDFYKCECNVSKPIIKQGAKLKFIQKNEANFFIVLDNIEHSISQQFDFHFDKFQNNLSWFNQTQQRVYCVSFKKNSEDLIKTEKALNQIFHQMEEFSLKSKFVNTSSLFQTGDRGQVFQMLFDSNKQYNSSILKQYDKKQDFEILNVGERLPKMIVEQSNISKTDTVEGDLLVSDQYGFIIAFKKQFMSIYKFDKQKGITIYSQGFVIQSKQSKHNFKPVSVCFTNDQRQIIFAHQNSAIIGLFDLESMSMVDQMKLCCNKPVLSFKCHLNEMFYALTEDTLYEIAVEKEKFVLHNSRTFNKDWIMRALTITRLGTFSTGCEDGTIRMYPIYESKKSSNNITLTKPIIDMCYSKDNSILVVVTKTKLCLYVFTKKAFTERLESKQKIGKYLKLSQQDRQYFKIKQFNYKSAKFIVQDSYIVTFTHHYLIVWQVKKILKNETKQYSIINMKQNILAVSIVADKSLIVNMVDNIEVIDLVMGQ